MEYLVQGDIGTQVKATIRREDDGSAVDLSEATVRFKFRKKGTSTVLTTLTPVSGSEDAANGIVIFQFASGDLDVDKGYYEGEIEATFDTGLIETVYEVTQFYVREDF